jgi:CheY-like chemotaxis protein
MPASAPAGVPRRILIVDDDAPTSLELKTVLEQAGHKVAIATSFAEGRSALSTAPPDLLISEIRLGEFNGLQLVATHCPAIPTIVLTGYRDSVLEADARQLGAEFLLKPVSRPALLAIVKQKLNPVPLVPVFSTMRRWTRRQLRDGVLARIQNSPVRVVDIGYGGLRFELEYQSDQALPTRFQLDLFDSGLILPLELVWTTRTEGLWVCGAALPAAGCTADRTWRTMVDTME